jgi:hypothetical protein
VNYIEETAFLSGVISERVVGHYCLSRKLASGASLSEFFFPIPIKPFALLKDLLKVGILTPLILRFRLVLPPDGTLGASSFFFPIPRKPDETDEDIPLPEGDAKGCGLGELLYCCCCDRGGTPEMGALFCMAPAFAEPLDAKLLEKLSDGAVREDAEVSAV